MIRFPFFLSIYKAEINLFSFLPEIRSFSFFTFSIYAENRSFWFLKIDRFEIEAFSFLSR